MKNVKIPVAYWHCILAEREREMGEGMEGGMETGRDGETAVERERQSLSLIHI